MDKEMQDNGMNWQQMEAAARYRLRTETFGLWPMLFHWDRRGSSTARVDGGASGDKLNRV